MLSLLKYLRRCVSLVIQNSVGQFPSQLLAQIDLPVLTCGWTPNKLFTYLLFFTRMSCQKSMCRHVVIVVLSTYGLIYATDWTVYSLYYFRVCRRPARLTEVEKTSVWKLEAVSPVVFARRFAFLDYRYMRAHTEKSLKVKFQVSVGRWLNTSTSTQDIGQFCHR